MKNSKLQEILCGYPDDIEVSIGNNDIFSIEQLPAYYDGLLHKIVFNEHNQISGISITGEGKKLVLEAFDLDELMFSYPEIEIDISELNEQRKLEYAQRIANYTKENDKIKTESERSLFIKFVFKNIDQRYVTAQNEVVVSNFFHENIKCRTKIPLITEDGITESYSDAINRFWENKYSIEIEKNRVMIKEKK